MMESLATPENSDLTFAIRMLENGVEVPASFLPSMPTYDACAAIGATTAPDEHDSFANYTRRLREINPETDLTYSQTSLKCIDWGSSSDPPPDHRPHS